MTVLILAAGLQERWRVDNPMRIQKQLIPICGDPIIARTVKMCLRYGEDPMVVTNDIEIAQGSGANHIINPQYHGTVLETIISTVPYWGDWTTILLGDVIYSPWAIAVIMGCAEPLTFFGRRADRIRPIGKYHEIFGIKFSADAGIVIARDHLPAAQQANDWQKIRTLYNTINHFPAKSFKTERAHFWPIEDWTEDIDALEDLLAFKAVALGRGMCREVL